MRVYKEEGINPAGSCLPLFLQMPVLIVLYDVIKGLSNRLITLVQGHSVAVPRPRYIPTSSRLYRHLVANHGTMNWLGINLALKPFSAHALWFGFLPYVALVLVAVALQYVQVAQTKRRSPATAQTNPRMGTVLRFFPILSAFIYFVVPGLVVLYVIVSTAMRIGIQFVLFEGVPPALHPRPPRHDRRLRGRAGFDEPPASPSATESKTMEIADTLSFLLGQWTVERLLTDHRSGTDGRFEGAVSISEAPSSQSAESGARAPI